VVGNWTKKTPQSPVFVRPERAETPSETASTATNAEPEEDFAAAYGMYAESSDEELGVESDNSQDADWDEYEPAAKKKKKKKKNNNNNSNSTKTAAAKNTAAVPAVPKPAPPKIAEPSPAAFPGPTGGGGSVTLYCNICGTYSTANSTVMRHHVMSHLQYYPYSCPHCTLFRAVRSFPIIKHIRGKHRGMEERFVCNLDTELEGKVKCQV